MLLDYVDNDIIQKLCAVDLVDEALNSLGRSGSQRVVLPTARFKLGTAKDPKKGCERYGDAAFNRMCTFIAGAAVAAVGHVDDLIILGSKPGIDQGEAQLFSLASRDDNAILITGDKKSLLALLREPDCAPVAQKLTGRVVCFEQLVLNVIKVYGFEAVRDRLSNGATSDFVLRMAFGSGPLTPLDTVMEALTSYAKELTGHSSGLMRSI